MRYMVKQYYSGSQRDRDGVEWFRLCYAWY